MNIRESLKTAVSAVGGRGLDVLKSLGGFIGGVGAVALVENIDNGSLDTIEDGGERGAVIDTRLQSGVEASQVALEAVRGHASAKLVEGGVADGGVGVVGRGGEVGESKVGQRLVRQAVGLHQCGEAGEDYYVSGQAGSVHYRL